MQVRLIIEGLFFFALSGQQAQLNLSSNIVIEDINCPYYPYWLYSQSMKIELPKLNCQLSLVFYQNSVFCILSSVFTIYICRENSTNQPLIMQNKPNFPYFLLENDDFTKKQTQFKANQTQFWPITRPGKAKQTQYHRVWLTYYSNFHLQNNSQRKKL